MLFHCTSFRQKVPCFAILQCKIIILTRSNEKKWFLNNRLVIGILKYIAQMLRPLLQRNQNTGKNYFFFGFQVLRVYWWTILDLIKPGVIFKGRLNLSPKVALIDSFKTCYTLQTDSFSNLLTNLWTPEQDIHKDFSKISTQTSVITWHKLLEIVLQNTLQFCVALEKGTFRKLLTHWSKLEKDTIRCFRKKLPKTC